MKSLKKLKNVINDKDKKPLLQIIKELKVVLKDDKREGSIGYYFYNLMHKKDAGRISDYLSYGPIRKIMYDYYRANGEHPILQNKNKFREYLYDKNLPIPEYIGKIKGGVFIDRNDDSKNISKDNFNNIFNGILQKYEVIFVKAVDGQGGAGVYKLSKENIDDIEKEIDYSQEYIIEQALIQDDYLNSINPHSLNTLRVITYNNGKEVVIPSCFFRMGTGNSYVDNGSSGGIFMDYNIDTNKLTNKAYRLLNYGGQSFEKHPTSGFIFKDKPLPYPENVKKIVSDAAKLFPELEIIGWDIAYTKNGPVILEGNDNPHIVMMQIGCKGLKNNPVYKELFKPYYK